MKTKAYDCIADKRRAQAELMREFEARRDEFKDYADFVTRTVDEGAFAREMRARMASSRRGDQPELHTRAA
jgi:hypothetical protein